MRALKVLTAGVAGFLITTLAIVMLMLVLGGIFGGASVAWMNWPGFIVAVLFGFVAGYLAWYAGKPRLIRVDAQPQHEERHIPA